MTREKLKQMISEVVSESQELVLTDTNALISKSSTLEDFMKTLVGKKLKGLLDATSFARLYVLNKYGVGSFPDENDIQANVAALMDNITAFINFRKLDGLSKQREEWDKEQYARPEYKEWLKQRALAFKAYRDARDSNSPDAEDLRKTYQTVASSDPTLPEYRKMMADKEALVNQFHNRPLTLDDVLPGPDDTEADKKRWSAIENSFNKLKNMNESKFTRLAKQMMVESMDETIINVRHRIKLKNMKKDGWSVDGWDNKKEGKIKVIRTNPKTNKMETGIVDRKGNFTLKENTDSMSTVQIYTGGNRGTTLLLYKGDARGTDRSSDKHIKTPTQFMSLINSLDSTGDTAANEDIKNILKKLTPDELESLKSEKIIVTNNVKV